jgi:predicted nucleic-acid-binding protein
MIAADTNVLLRAILDDDAVQSPLARNRLQEEDQVFILPVVLCELVWVLKQHLWSRAQIGEVVRTLVSASNVRVDTLLVDTGLAFLERGGRFADGVILHHARASGCDALLTFDQTLARLGAPDVTLVS